MKSTSVLCSLIALASVCTQSAVALDAGMLIPQPQVVESREGSFELDPGSVRFLVTAKSMAAADRLADLLAESLDRAGIRTGPHAIMRSEGRAFSLVVGTPPLTAPQATRAFPADAREQGYQLLVTPSAIEIRAVQEVGLFYGMMTLEQLFTIATTGGGMSLDCARILDWPDLPMRGFSEDYGRNQLPTMEDHRRTIRNLARFKMNVHLFFIESDHFVYAFDPDLGSNRDRFTFDELRDIVAYAKRYYIDVIPTVELLGHMEETLRNPKYTPLAEVPGAGDLCATSDESFKLIENMVGEIAPAFASAYFHCGLDESWQIGKGKSKEAVEKYGHEKVMADYYIRMNDLVRSHGKQMMMYADIALKYPGCLEMLPKDIVMMFWEYTVRERYQGVDVLKNAGFPVVTLSSLWDWRNIYPLYSRAFLNIDRLAAQTVDAGLMGHFVSSWGDAYRGVAGMNLSEFNNFGVAYCCSQGWKFQPVPIAEFADEFALHFFGSDSPELARALTLLAECQGDRGGSAREVVHDEIKNILDRMSKADENELAFWQKIHRDAESARDLLKRQRPSRNAEYIPAFVLSANMFVFSADLAMLSYEMARDIAADTFNSHKYTTALDRLAKRHKALGNEYHRVYAATNRPINLKYIDDQWEWMHGELSGLATRIRAKEFPPKG